MKNSKKLKVMYELRKKGYWSVDFSTTKAGKVSVKVMVPYTGCQYVSDTFLPDTPLAQIMIVMLHHIENFRPYR